MIEQPRVWNALLPPASSWFVVLTDTHLVDPSADHAGEFGSRLKQNDRVEVALELVRSMVAPRAVHLGDLVQDYPDSDTHNPLLSLATQQVRQIADRVSVAAGNTDVGDKPDPSSPAMIADTDTVGRFRDLTAPPWSEFSLGNGPDGGPLRGVVLASSILNSGSPLEAEQWAWLERILAEPGEVVLFWHHPIFLRDADDPGLGNYDSIAEPARSRLLELIRTHPVRGLFTGHSHFWFRTVLGPQAQAYGINSTSFTRPGFCELFSSAAPADRGRDDVDKLGFVVVRVHADGLRVHPVRSGTVAGRRGEGLGGNPVLTGTPRDCAPLTLGVVSRHPIATQAEVPDTFPSVVRQPVRDDHPLLGCLELGLGRVSVGPGDVATPWLAERLALLRNEGVAVVVRTLWPAGAPLPELPADSPVDAWELVLLDRAHLSDDEVRAATRLGVPITFSALRRLPRGAAELSRWRYGFDAAELEDAASWRGSARLLASRAGVAKHSVQLAEWLAEHRWVDVVTPAPPADDPAALFQLAADMLAVTSAGSRLWVDGLTELDRTLELNPGLLDRMRNPRPAFHLLRVLNTLCHARPAEISVVEGAWTIRREDLTAQLVAAPNGTGEVIDLATGMQLPDTAGSTGPYLMVRPTG